MGSFRNDVFPGSYEGLTLLALRDGETEAMSWTLEIMSVNRAHERGPGSSVKPGVFRDWRRNWAVTKSGVRKEEHSRIQFIIDSRITFARHRRWWTDVLVPVLIVPFHLFHRFMDIHSPATGDGCLYARTRLHRPFSLYTVSMDFSPTWRIVSDPLCLFFRSPCYSFAINEYSIPR